MAKKIGIDRFRIQRTRRLDPKLDIKSYDNPEWFKKINVEYENALSPFCYTGDMHYITAFGDYYPCCWFEGRYNGSRWKPLNIKNNTVQSFEKHFKNFTHELEDFETCPDVCKKFCRKIKNNGKDMQVPNSQLNRSIIDL